MTFLKLLCARIGNGVHGDVGLGPGLEPHLVPDLDQLGPAKDGCKRKPCKGLPCERKALSSLVNEAGWKSRARHVRPDVHQRQLKSHLVIRCKGKEI